MKKDLGIIGGLFLLVLLILIFGKGFSSSIFLLSGGEATQSSKQTSTLSVKTLNINIEIADSLPERKKGLGERETLAINSGMLFIFDKSDKWAIWMKGMRFPIDIIWINEDKKIVDFAASVQPQPGKPDRELVIYTPREKAKYVLEINAGLADINNLRLGDAVIF